MKRDTGGVLVKLGFLVHSETRHTEAPQISTEALSCIYSFTTHQQAIVHSQSQSVKHSHRALWYEIGKWSNVKSSQVRLVEEVVGGVCTVSARDVDRGRWYLNNIHINTCMRIHARVRMPIGSCWQIGHVCRVSCGFNVVWNRALEPHSEARVAASNSKASADPRIPCHENARASRVNRLTAD